MSNVISLFFLHRSITEKDLDDISFHYRSDRSALGFLADYSHTDVNVIQLSGKSTAVWAISPPSQVLSGRSCRLLFQTHVFNMLQLASAGSFFGLMCI